MNDLPSACLLGDNDDLTLNWIAMNPDLQIPLTDAEFEELDTLLDRCREAKVDAPLKAVATKTNRTWRFDALLAHLAEERAAYAAAAAEK